MTSMSIEEVERTKSICLQEVCLAEYSLKARNILDLDYNGHGRKQYEWQASQLIGHLENALAQAKKLPLYS